MLFTSTSGNYTVTVPGTEAGNPNLCLFYVGSTGNAALSTALGTDMANDGGNYAPSTSADGDAAAPFFQNICIYLAFK